MLKKKSILWNACFILWVLGHSLAEVIQKDVENKQSATTENITSSKNDKSESDKIVLIESSSFAIDNVNGSVGNFGQNIIADPSHNSGIFNGASGSTPMVVSVSETANLELKTRAEDLSASFSDGDSKKSENRTENVNQSSDNDLIDENKTDLEEAKNDTDARNKTNDSQEEIPSFSEWAQKRLKEVEKNEEASNESVQHHAGLNGKIGSGVKLGWKNYASPDCGAKVVAANPEAVSPSSVISPSREEYKLNVCTNKIWFIVELCEAIQAKKIDIANFELFSSTPKDFTVSVGDRFPTREWTTVGQFTAKDERDVQRFDLNPYLFGRYIKVEVKSHHGSQHYCPISLFRVYGISEMEVLQKEELAHTEDDDDEDDEVSSKNVYTDDLAKNMLNSATNAVFSMIKKAAEVLGTKSNDTEEKERSEVDKHSEYSPLINTCTTPSHRIVCVNCTDLLFGQIYELASCRSAQIERLVRIPYVRRSLMNSDICHGFGLNFNAADCDRTSFDGKATGLRSFFSPKILGAMCNSLAVIENRAVLNVSDKFTNVTTPSSATTTTTTTTRVSSNDNNDVNENMPADVETTSDNNNDNDMAVNLEQSGDFGEKIAKMNEDDANVAKATEELKVDLKTKEDLSKPTCSTDIFRSSQINPTKTVKMAMDSFELPSVVTVSDERRTKRTEEGGASVENDSEKGAERRQDADTENAQQQQQQMETTTESAEGMEPMDHFMTDENGPSTVPSVSSNQNTDRQKESVFLRLSNRIKALERNVSLSSQYLEELSRRYKKQVEEMQKLMEKTLQTITEERIKMEDRNRQLEERLDHLMMTIGRWPSIIFWFLLSLAIVCAILWRCAGVKRSPVSTSVVERRKSIDVVQTATKKPKIRRPSDQALKIVRSSLLTEEKRLNREKRRRKRSGNKALKRSNSVTGLEGVEARRPPSRTVTTSEKVRNIHSMENSNSSNNSFDWVEENRRVLEVVPLDEPDHSSLEPFSTIVESDVPLYAATAVERRAHRLSTSTSQFNGPNINGDRRIVNLPRKGGSLDESKQQRFDGNSLRRSSLNVRIDDNTGRKKERRSIKSVLKNVFS